jgi:hypothetical protein
VSGVRAARSTGRSERRFDKLELYNLGVENALQVVHRPTPIRRVVKAEIEDGLICAARLSRRLDVDMPNAWRALEAAAGLGVLAPLCSAG